VFNWDIGQFSVQEARAYLEGAKKRGAKIKSCSLCNVTPVGTTCPVCDNPGLQQEGAGPDPIAAFTEMVKSGGNAFVVGSPPQGGVLIVNIGPLAGRVMSKEEATNLAAWLIVAGNLNPEAVSQAIQRAERNGA
jgi:hypothetical protein